MKSIRNLFSAEDFMYYGSGGLTPQGYADRAQKILDEYLDLHGTKVYSDSNGFKRSQYTCIHYHGPEPSFKESAILVDIQPIEKECEHHSIMSIPKAGIVVGGYSENDPFTKSEAKIFYEFKCLDCGAKLKPTGWEVV